MRTSPASSLLPANLLLLRRRSSPSISAAGTLRSEQVFAQVAADLQRLYDVRAEVVLSDAHPDYATTRWARTSGLVHRLVQHHRAHASALVTEHGRADAPAIVACANDAARMCTGEDLLRGLARGDYPNPGWIAVPGGAYDRSPCGTGTSARLACLASNAQLLLPFNNS